MSSIADPCATSRPWSSTAIRWANWSASSRYWVVRKIVTPLPARSRMICHMVRRPRGSRPALGSAQVVQVGHQDQVLLTGEEVNNGRELAGDTNLGAHRGKIGGQFVSGDVRTLGGRR